MRTTIKNTENGVELTYTPLNADSSERYTRVFSTSGRYVVDVKGRQVCKKLSGGGDTLTCSGNLIDVIRREYAAMRRAELAEK